MQRNEKDIPIPEYWIHKTLDEPESVFLTDQFEFLANRSRDVDGFAFDALDGDDCAAVRPDLSEHLTRVELVLRVERRNTRSYRRRHLRTDHTRRATGK